MLELASDAAALDREHRPLAGDAVATRPFKFRIPWPNLPLRTRTLLLAGFGILALLVADSLISITDLSRSGQTALRERAELLASTQALALSVPLWDFDRAQTRAAIDALASDPDFHAARIRDTAGKVVAERINPAPGASSTLSASREVVYTQNGALKVLGTLELEFSTDRLATAFRSLLRYQIVSRLILLGAMLLTVLAAIRQLTRPLDMMTRATARLAGGDRTAVIPALGRMDEVGAMARAIQVFKVNAIALAEAEEKYRAIYENAALGLYRARLDGGVTEANPALVRFAGYRGERDFLEDFGSARALATHWYVNPSRWQDLSDHLQKDGMFAGCESEVHRRDGARGWISESARLVYDEAGKVFCYEGTVEDITERRRLAEEDRLRVRSAVESASDAVVITDPDSRPVYVNPAFRSLLGYDVADLQGSDWTTFVFADPALRRDLQAALQTGGSWNGEADLLAHRAGTLSMAVRANPIWDANKNATGSVFIFTDVSARKRAEEQLRYMAQHDALTGLPNRAFLRERLVHALAKGRRTGNAVAIFCLDLDRFKQVNDSLGHGIGDRLLEAVTERLQSCTRQDDTVARLGGDEFVIVQPSAPQPGAADALSERLIARLSEPFHIAGHDVQIGASVGVALFPAHGDDPDRLLHHADIALYQAKADGRGQHRFFEPHMYTHVQDRMTLERDLRKAIAACEFELYYQPQVNLDDGRVIGAEALLRWIHPERGLVSPADFIPLAEETGLIIGLGEWVIRTACEQASTWPVPLRVAVNLSPRQFRQSDLAIVVQRILNETGFSPDRLELEITEGVLLQDTDQTLAMLRALKNLGVRIAMDDFGTGYSSLSYLRRFPFDKIKIDQSFIRDLERGPDAKAIVRAIVALSGSLSMQANAEGVETAEQASFLRGEGCGEVQGSHFGRPTPHAGFLALLDHGPH